MFLVFFCLAVFLDFHDLDHFKENFSVILFVLIFSAVRLRLCMLVKIAQKWYALFCSTCQPIHGIEMSSLSLQ
jgi:cell division protein FtsW (lipid II flippase)